MSFPGDLISSGSYPPLEADESVRGAKSDHRIAHAEARLPRFQTFKRLSYSYRYMDPEKVEDFGAWLVHRTGQMS